MELINDIKFEINHYLNNVKLDDLYTLKNIIQRKKGLIFLTGIGKCESISIHFADLLKSISYKAFHISIQNASHGDIGCMNNDDICIIFSKSGNTDEIVNFINIIKLKNIQIISISCTNECKIKKLSHFHLVLPFQNELKKGIHIIPNNSSLIMLIFINIIIKLLEEIDIEDYKINHLGGFIGNNLKTVEEIMIKDYPKFKIINSIPIIDLFIEITDKNINTIIFHDENNTIIGVLTNYDLKKILVKDKNKNNIFINDINKNYIKIEDKTLKVYEIKNKIIDNYVPVLENKKCIGLISKIKIN